ncbi:MAG TPA: hypothetical protein VIW03_03305 [Anaeromyxobacter sp.]
MRRLCLCILLSFCLLAPTAAAKGIAEVTACGASGCQDATPDKDRHDFGIVEGGPQIGPPSAKAPWFRLRVRLGVPDQPVGSAIRIAYIPSLHVIRTTQTDGSDTWMQPTAHSENALKRAVAGLVPFDAETLDLSTHTKTLPAPRVDEVVPAPRPGDPPSSDGAWVPWAAGGAAVLLLLAATGLLLRRRRAGPDPHPVA